jgi:hypothetical protein
MGLASVVFGGKGGSSMVEPKLGHFTFLLSDLFQEPNLTLLGAMVTGFGNEN